MVSCETIFLKLTPYLLFERYFIVDRGEVNTEPISLVSHDSLIVGCHRIAWLALTFTGIRRITNFFENVFTNFVYTFYIT